MKISIKDLMLWYHSLIKQIEEKELVIYTPLEEMMNYDENYYEEKKRLHKEKLKNDVEYCHLLSVLEQLGAIEINIEVEVPDVEVENDNK